MASAADVVTQNTPTTLSVAIAVALVAGTVGYFLGQFTSLSHSTQAPILEPQSGLNSLHKGVVDIDDRLAKEEYKLVLVVRTDLGMTKGKIAAQCGHATLACYKSALSLASSSQKSRSTSALSRWEHMGQAKIALQCRGEDELLVHQAEAISLGLIAEVIHDAGRTQIAANSATVLGIGPGPKSIIDQVTGSLKLL